MLIHNQVSWDEYRYFEKTEVGRVVGEVKDYLNKKNSTKFSDLYYYTLFYQPLSSLVFSRFLAEKGIIPERKSKSASITSFVKMKLNENSSSQIPRALFQFLESQPNGIGCLEFFHRHSAYKQMFKSGSNFSELSKPRRVGKSWGLNEFRAAKSILKGLISSDELLHDTWLPTLFDSSIQRQMEDFHYPRVLLTNAHGLYFSQLASFYVANLVEKRIPILVNQPGLIHPHLKFIDQLEYESRICTRYLGWGSNRGAIPSNVFCSFGSFYADRHHLDGQVIDATLVVLPQLPSASMRPFSMYYGDPTRGGFEFIDRLMKSLSRNIKKFSGRVVLRCKEGCREYYSRKICDENLRVYLESGNVNEFDQQYGHYKTIVTAYVGTSLIESIRKAEKAYFIVDREGAALNEEFSSDLHALPNCFSSFDEFEHKEYDHIAISKFLDKYAKSITPEHASEELNRIVRDVTA